ncbi:MAG: FtsX-like permease family protein [Myxococcota bacterium]
MIPYVHIALRNLVRSRRRSLLLGAGLALVTASLVFTMSLANGLHDTIVRSATILLSGHVNVGGFYKYKRNDAHAVVTDFERIESIIAEEVEGVRYVVDRQRGFATLTSEVDSLQAVLAGIDVEQEPELARALVASDAGRGDVEGLTNPNTIVLFEEQAAQLEVEVGDRITLSAQLLDGTVNTADVEVVAIAKDVGTLSGWNAFVHQSTVRTFYRLGENTTGAIFVYLDDPLRSDEVASTLRDVLAREGYALMRPRAQPYWEKFSIAASGSWTGQRLDVTTWRDEVSTVQWTLDAVNTVSRVLVAILVLIIVVGITNTMWISVRERTREIGTLRAIGMTRHRVLAMLVIESGVLGVLSASFGALFAAALAVTLDAAQIRVPSEAMRAVILSDVIHLSVEISPIIWAIVAFTVVTVLAGLWPAFTAARLSPITAIQRTG